MNHIEVLNNFSNRLENERLRLNYTQAQMADKLSISLSTYKRIISNEITKIDIYTLYLACKLTGLTSCEFLNPDEKRTHMLEKLSRLSPSQLSYIENIINFELSLSDLSTSNLTDFNTNSLDHCIDQPSSISTSINKKDSTSIAHKYLTVFIPTGNMKDGMIYDSSSLDKIDVTRYVKKYGNRMHFGIKITSIHLQPVYNIGDILLICTNPIRDGDTGVFVDRQTSRIYIRKFHQTNPCMLEPINNFGETFYIDSTNEAEMNKWMKLGYILTKIRG